MTALLTTVLDFLRSLWPSSREDFLAVTVSYKSLVERLESRIEHLEGTIERLEANIAELRAQLERCHSGQTGENPL